MKNEFVHKPIFRWLVVDFSWSEKSNLIRYMVTNYELFSSIFDTPKHIFVMFPTCDMSKDCEYLRKQNFFEFYDEGLLKKIIETQRALIKSWKQTPFILIILDDCVKYVGSSSHINQLITKIRHYNISLIELCQKFNAVGRTALISFDSKILEN